jgi:metallo-beta-lactamase family protein
MSSLLFAGAAGEVTGSRHLLTLPSGKLLLDCGMFQGRREESAAKSAKFLFQPSQVGAVILSHAHIDHCGSLPLLVKQGFKGPIYCTPATAELAKLLLLDSAHIQDQDAYFWNKRHPGAPIKPAYDEHDVAAAARLLRPQPMTLAFEPLPGVQAHFHEAGHILGSAQVSLRWNENGQERDFYFTGDLGQMGTPLLKDPFQPRLTPQILLLESTYGDREHGDGSPILSSLQEAVAPVLKRGGKVLIPSFAVGRTQELIYELAELIKEGRLPTMTIYVDSPLAEATTKLFRQHRELMDADFHAVWRTQDPFAQGFVHFTGSKEESQAINDHEGPCIILAASGMCEAGRVLHHLEQLLPDPKNLVLFVGFQAQGTLGRRLKDGAKLAKLYGQEVAVLAQVQALDGFSAHAGRTELLNFVRALPTPPAAIHLVHGETSASSALAATLRQEGYTVEVATLGKEVQL